jgi:hypothetical protein
VFNEEPKEPQESQDSSPFFAMDQPVFDTELAPEEKSTQDMMFGLTPVQRFVIMLLIFLLTCVLGSLCLLITGRIVLPF